jgi:hypothetical protein
MKLENENLNEAEKPQLNIAAVMRSYLPSIKMLRKENFYNKEPVKILRISLLGKVVFYHLTFNRFL